MKHCIIHPSEYYEATCPSCDQERASSSLQQDGYGNRDKKLDKAFNCDIIQGMKTYNIIGIVHVSGDGQATFKLQNVVNPDDILLLTRKEINALGIKTVE
jgi:hypothetical protein